MKKASPKSLKPSKSPIHTTDLEPTPSLLSRHKDKLIMAGLGLTVLTLFSTLIFRSSALTNQFIPLSLTSSTNTTGSVQPVPDATAAGGSYLKFVAAGQDPSPNPPATSGDYDSNLAKILSSTFRNRNEDNSPYLYTPSVELPTDPNNSPLLSQSYRKDYADKGSGGQADFKEYGIEPIGNEGKFRTDCEFSHFAYDDPIVFPNQPEAAHLHMFFGNTHANAYSTYETIIDTGGSTCNGQELNRTAYWAPAIIDGNGNVRIPERAIVYYKSFNGAIGSTSTYPEGLWVVDQNVINRQSGAEYQASFLCVGSFNNDKYGAGHYIPNCSGGSGNYGSRRMLEQNIKFKHCWNGQDPTDYENNLTYPSGHFWSGSCPGSHPIILPALEYRIWYPIMEGEDTSTWFLSSDVDPRTGAMNRQRGDSSHADWFGGWNKVVNQMWITNCNNRAGIDCGHGHLGGNGLNDPYPALRRRNEFTANPQYKVPGEQLYREICSNTKTISSPYDLAYCFPG